MAKIPFLLKILLTVQCTSQAPHCTFVQSGGSELEKDRIAQDSKKERRESRNEDAGP